jgi:hypothetical protein
MNFDTFRESLSSFARTAERLQSLASSLSDSIAPVPITPLPAPLLQSAAKKKLPTLPPTEVFRTMHMLCSQARRVSGHQPAWNEEFTNICQALSESLSAFVRAFHPGGDRSAKVKEQLRDMRSKLKQAARLSPKRQRRWNDAGLAALAALLKAHAFIGSSKLEQAGAKAETLKDLQKKLTNGQKYNDRAARGLRRLMGNRALDQRRINHECYRILESLTKLQIKLQGILLKRIEQQNAALMQNWLDQSTAAVLGRMESQRVDTRERLKKLQTSIATQASRIHGLEDELLHNRNPNSLSLG